MSASGKFTKSDGDPDCGGLTFAEVEARINDHTLPRPTVPQLTAFMRERRRRLDAKFKGIPLVSHPGRN